MEDNLHDDERQKLRLENEIRKIKLSLETGAKFMSDSDMSEIPPEIENQFLDYVEKFEKLNENSPRITIFQRLGSPQHIKKSNEVPDNELETELDKLIELLEAHQIGIDTKYEVSDRELYRFIVEELFEEEILDMQLLEGMVSQFSYEDFHPNYEEDLKQAVKDFTSDFFDKENQYCQYEVTQEGRTWCEQFRSAYSGFKVNHLDIISFDYSPLLATVNIDIDVWAYLDEYQTHIYKGKGTLHFVYDHYWNLDKVELPPAL